jgi:hypothetical protein
MELQPIRLRPARVRQMGLRRAPLRKPAVPPRNDHVHLFSTEASSRRLLAAMRAADEGRYHRITLEELCARYGLNEA